MIYTMGGGIPSEMDYISKNKDITDWSIWATLRKYEAYCEKEAYNRMAEKR